MGQGAVKIPAGSNDEIFGLGLQMGNAPAMLASKPEQWLLLARDAAAVEATPGKGLGQDEAAALPGFVAVAGVNAAVFHRVPFRSVGDWDTETSSPFLARSAAVVSLAAWTGAIACGRLLAYL